MYSRNLAPPSPEVQYLPALFRKIEKGDIRLPAFQRSFVWSEAQVIKLLESVYEGYPIGSVLFWKVDHQLLRIADDDRVPFPDVEEHYPLSFVLDGMQRLSSLFGVLHQKEAQGPNIFNVVFDLRRERFSHFDPNNISTGHLNLSALFSPRELIEAQRRLTEQPDSDLLLDRSIELQSVFQEYLVPTVTIAQRETSQVVEIFERVNSTGTPLSTVDFMRAMTWSTNFDLGREVTRLQSDIAQEGYVIPLETLVKILAVVLRKAPTPSEMLGLGDHSAENLHQAMRLSKKVLHRVIAFLKANCTALSYDFVPYEGQFLVLVGLFSSGQDPSLDLIASARRWFWAISFSEGLRGKPDHYVTRAINSARRAALGEVDALDYRLNLSSQIFLSRPFIKGRALSAAVASMLATAGARSLVSGDLLDVESYMTEFSGEQYVGLYSLDTVQATVANRATSSKIIANTVLVPEGDRLRVLDTTPKLLIESLFNKFNEVEAQEILRSQFISPAAAEMILEDRPADFLRERARVLYSGAASLASAEQ